MKNTYVKPLATLLLFAISVLLLSMKPDKPSNDGNTLNGAWFAEIEGTHFSLLFADDYCTFTQYQPAEKKFMLTTGGPYTIENDAIKMNTQFNSADKNTVGKPMQFTYRFSGDDLVTNLNGLELQWKRVDAGNKHLAGNWRIVQRKQDDGTMADMPLHARRTLKLLTATRFQWMAINIESGKFFGTGGGTYSFKDGKYTENIEFFSRDSSRVGMALTFDGKLENGNWIHSGKSSKGDPVYEIWNRITPADNNKKTGE